MNSSVNRALIFQGGGSVGAYEVHMKLELTKLKRRAFTIQESKRKGKRADISDRIWNNQEIDPSPWNQKISKKRFLENTTVFHTYD